ncbi:hypothetical protein EDF52_10286 [Curtobacterium sp. PhB42]|uniref:hypothetical protein n=1 Tax=unclassified Curtobacterium TaxID=257496 RepID=UPI001063EE16|nr:MULTISPECIES: hypothetical protein [unclassified Curtobacterium]TDW50998.1 hypothetical protein EDF52_10286 [Curtobacterium sp. PhB42]TDW56156.1 hypothetical protein EDF47_104267 [Curtobacterium sp. PhB190]
MAGGFSIGVAADTRAFEAGVKAGIIDPIEDAQDALEDLGKSGDKAADGLSDGLQESEKSLGKLGREAKDAGNDIERGMKDAERATDRLGDAGKEAGNDLEKGLKHAQRQTNLTADDYKAMTAKVEAETRKLKQQGKDSFTPAAESSAAFKDEAVSNLSEVASSFDGSATSIVDLFQGTLGGIITELGPLGLAAGTAAAVGIGLIGTAFSQSGEDSDAFKERVKSMTDELVSEFSDSGDAVSALDKKLREWASDTEKYGTSLVQLQKDAKSVDRSFKDWASTIAGGTTKELKGLQKQVKDTAQEQRRLAASVDTTAGADRSASREASKKADALTKDVLPAIQQQIEANQNAKDAEEALAAANGKSVKEYRRYVEAQTAAKEANDSFADSMQSLAEQSAESTSDILDNSALSAEKYIRDTQKRQAADAEYYANLSTVGKEVPADVLNYLKEQGDAFSQELATYLAATPEQQAQILETWKTAAGAGTDIDGPTVKAKGDTSDVDKKTAEKGKETKAGPTSKLKADAKDVDKTTAAKGREKKDGPTLKFRDDTSEIDKAIARYRDKKVTGPTVKFLADTSAVDAAAARIRNNPITQTVNQRIGKRVA